MAPRPPRAARRYRGAIVSSLGAMWYSTAVLGMFEGLRQGLEGHVPTAVAASPASLATFQILLAAAGTAGAQALTYPIDTLRRRYVADGGSGPDGGYASLRDVWRRAFAGEGAYAGLYRGFGVGCLRAVPSTAALMYVYDSARKEMRDML